MPIVKVNDINMYYEIHGEGFPLVMIIGLSADINWWGQPLLDRLSKLFKVIIFDNRGAGRTDKPDIPYSIKMMTDDTMGLLDNLDIKQFNLLGISMGGMIAQEIAVTYPERVAKLVLCSTSAGGSKYVPPTKEVFELLMSTEDLSPEEVIEGTIPLLHTEEYIKNNPHIIEESKEAIAKNQMPRYAFKRQIGGAMAFSAGRKLKKLTVPTLILQGKQDQLIPFRNAEILADLIPNSHLVLFKKTAHALFSVETENVIKTLIDFLKN